MGVALRQASAIVLRVSRSLAVLALSVGLCSTPLAAAHASGSNDAAIVIDANTGKTLFASNPDAPRYPASLTKMMTLYLTFDALKAGKITKTTLMPVSRTAASQAPSKLGLKPGQTISVEDAILSLVTRSANDSAMVLGEYLGGSASGFARMMTFKARRLGMSNTTFRNPNGLPDPQQRTTARDMAILGMALRQNHPQYYGYFSTRSFAYAGHTIGNHNRLLGRVSGVDGIKTGYTRVSGFNLVSSVAIGDRRLVAVVMGGESGRSRDNHMAQLIRTYLPRASTAKGKGLLIAAADPAPATAAEETEAVTAPVVKQAVAASVAESAKAVPGPSPKPAPMANTAKAAPAPSPKPAPAVETAYAEPAKQPPAPPETLQGQAQALRSQTLQSQAAALDPVQTSSTQAAAGWVIQVASADSETGARALLSKAAKQAGPLLADASGFTQPFAKNGAQFYRARFGGFSSKSDAWNTCGALKKKKIACYAVQQ